MSDPNQYRARVVATTPYSTEYENGTILPRDGFAHDDASAFEGTQPAPAAGAPSIFDGIERMPAAPMGGYAAGPQMADLRGGGADREDMRADTAAGRFAGEGPQYLPGSTEQQLMESSSAPGGPLGGTVTPFRAPTQQDFAQYGQGAAPPMGEPAVPTTMPADAYRPQPQPPPPPPQMVGGGGSSRTSTTTETQGGVPIDEDALRDFNHQSGLAANATQGLAQNRGDAAQNQATLAAQTASAARTAEKQRAAHERERTRAADIAESDYRRAAADFASKTVDPAKWYHDRGTGGTIMAAIAMSLGAFGASLTGGENTAVQLITDSINADIDAQKENIATAGKGLEAQEGLLAQMRERFGDERMAESATRAALLENARLKAEQLEQQARASGAPIEGELASARLKMEAAQENQRLRMLGADQVTVSETRARSSGGAGAGARAGAGEADPRAVERYALQRQAADSAQESLTAVQGLLAGGSVPGLGGPAGMAESLPNAAVGGEGRALRVHIRNMASALVQARTGAVASETERADMENLLGMHGNDDEVRAGVERGAAALTHIHDNLQGGFGPGVVNTYLQNGGNSPQQRQAGRRGTAGD